MLSFILIAAIVATAVYVIAKKVAKPEPIEDPVITENDVHEDLHSHVKPISEQTPPIVVIEPPVASVAPVVEELAVADEKPSVMAAAKKKSAKKSKKKVDA